MCMSGCFAISFFLVTQVWYLNLSSVSCHCINPSCELFWTLEQYNIDLMWKQFIWKVNLCLFTLYANYWLACFAFPVLSLHLQPCGRELSLLVFPPHKWGSRGEVTSHWDLTEPKQEPPLHLQLHCPLPQNCPPFHASFQADSPINIYT